MNAIPPAGPARDDYNLTDPAFYASHDPETILRRLRREDPVHWTMGRYKRGFWSVTRMADCRDVYERDDVFSSNRSGPMLPISTDYENPEAGDLLALQLDGAQISAMDGQPHLVLRRAFTKRFLQANVSKLEDVIRKLATDVLNDVLPRGECDFAVDVAGKLPLALICHVMDIPKDMWPSMYRWTYMSTSPEDPEFSIGTAEHTSRVGTGQLMEYCLSLAKERREKPGDDLISDIAVTKIDDKYLRDEVVAFNAISFVAAGHETTRNALCGAIAELIENNPAELERMRGLRHDKAAMLAAGMEAVRWSSPLTHQLRTAIADTEIAGQKVREGDWVVMWNNSANRDESAFPDSYRFDGTRHPNQNLGYGSGPHFCLGAHLARLELRVMWELLLESMHEIKPAGPTEVTPSLILRGIKHQPITFKARAPLPI